MESTDSYFLTVDEVIAELSKTPRVSEVCIQGGLHPRLEFSYILEMLQEIKTKFPQVHIHAFSPMEIYYFSQKSGRPVTSTIESLMDNGLDSFPGTAAEVLDDRLRMQICSEKVKVATWIEIVRTAHRLGLKSTATILFGHLETPAQAARHLEIIREIQSETHGFTELIPLPFVPFQTPLGKMFGIKEILPFHRIRFFYALCRIFCGSSIPNIQASWPKLGLDRALECVFSGVNDLGGTLYQENITRSAGGVHGERVTLSQFRRAIGAAGRIPRLRNTLYEFLGDHVLASLIKDEDTILSPGVTEPMDKACEIGG
jgi:CofH subfamily radical SAM domain protein